MAKQNRRINIARLEARALRAQLAREQESRRRETRELRETCAALAEAAPLAPPSLDTIIERLRAMCRDTFCLSARGQVASSSGVPVYRMRVPAPVADFIERGYSRSFVEREELVRFVLRFSEDAMPGFGQRYAHMRVISKDRTREVTLHLTPDSVALMGDSRLAVQWIAEEFGRAIAADIRAGHIR